MKPSYKVYSHLYSFSSDIGTLLNDRQDSDVQFKVGASSILQENGEIIYDESTTTTLYAHSMILRYRSPYFAAMFDKNSNWKESSNGIIYKPHISASIFQTVLYYIYTGYPRSKSQDNIVDLISAAYEMGLEELITHCKDELIRLINLSITEAYNQSTNPHISIDFVRKYIIPALNLANSELYAIIFPYISIIIKSLDAYTTFIDEISYEVFSEIIASNNLRMTERSIWDLTLNWACHQMELSRNALEDYLKNYEYNDKEDGSAIISKVDLGQDSTAKVVNILRHLKSHKRAATNSYTEPSNRISTTQLNDLKEILESLLPAIRFSLLDSDEYNQISNILRYFLSAPRFLELEHFFKNPDRTELLDTLRFGQEIPSVIAFMPIMWDCLRKSIFETGGITGCLSLNHLKFELLFRASEYDFSASAFHQRCDNKGPTLVLIKSTRGGYFFGGVNFNDWESEGTYYPSPLNFLFTLPEKSRGIQYAVFKINSKATKEPLDNNSREGPRFGRDLSISDKANTNYNYSTTHIPSSYYYYGSKTSNYNIAGDICFYVSDYEVFAISKRQ